MKKHKLEVIAKSAAILAFGSLSVLTCDFAAAQSQQDFLPPIIRSSAKKIASPETTVKELAPIVSPEIAIAEKQAKAVMEELKLPPIVTSSTQPVVPPITSGKKNLLMPSSNEPVPARDLVTQPLADVGTSDPTPRSRGLFSSLFSRKKRAQSSALAARNGMAAVTQKAQGAIAPIASVVEESSEKVQQATAIQSNAAESYRIARAYPTAVVAPPRPTSMVAPQGSSTRGVGSATRSVLGNPAEASLPPIQGFAPSTPAPPIISGSLMTQQPLGSGLPPVNAPYIPAPSESAPIYGDPVNAAPYNNAAPTYFDAMPAPLQSSVVGPSVVAPSGCSSCGGGGCDSCGTGGCDSCGTAGCDSCGPGGCYNPNRINCDYGTFGSVSAAQRYAYFDFLFYTREDGDINNSNFNPLGGFDGAPGWRVTLGARQDRLVGREISYFGVAPIETSSTTTDPAGRLNALFLPTGGLGGGDLSSFFGATTQTQFKDTVVHSIEANRVRWGWDVLRSSLGWRYIYFGDDYFLNSTAPVFDPFGTPIGTEDGRFRLDTNNHLIGGQIGAELFYDIGFRLSVSVVSKFGVYANLNKVDYFLENDGLTILDSEDNGATLATNYELNLLAHYQIRQSARLRFGYNAFFLSNVATVSDNFSGVVTPFSGFSGTDSDDAFIHGFSVGLEIFR